MKSNLSRFAPEVRDRAARFEEELGILSLSPDGLTVEAIDGFEAEILSDWERMGEMPLARYLDSIGHREPLTRSEADPAVRRHYVATEKTLLRGLPVCWDAARDHWDLLRRRTGRALIVNGNLAWLGSEAV